MVYINQIIYINSIQKHRIEHGAVARTERENPVASARDHAALPQTFPKVIALCHNLIHIGAEMEHHLQIRADILNDQQGIIIQRVEGAVDGKGVKMLTVIGVDGDRDTVAAGDSERRRDGHAPLPLRGNTDLVLNLRVEDSQLLVIMEVFKPDEEGVADKAQQSAVDVLRRIEHGVDSDGIQLHAILLNGIDSQILAAGQHGIRHRQGCTRRGDDSHGIDGERSVQHKIRTEATDDTDIAISLRKQFRHIHPFITNHHRIKMIAIIRMVRHAHRIPALSVGRKIVDAAMLRRLRQCQ